MESLLKNSLRTIHRAGQQDQPVETLIEDRVAAQRRIAINADTSDDLLSAQMISEIVSAYGLESLQLDGTSLEGTGYVTFRVITPQGILALRRKKGSASKIMAK